MRKANCIKDNKCQQIRSEQWGDILFHFFTQFSVSDRLLFSPYVGQAILERRVLYVTSELSFGEITTQI